MKIQVNLAACLTALCLFPACSRGAEPIPVEQAQAMTQELTKALMGELQSTMAAEGPAAAIRVCADLAPEKAQAIATEELTVRRVGTRVRNSKTNTPTAAEREVLAGLTPEQPTFSGQVDGHEVFIQGIFIPNAMCLVCHGEREAIPAEVRDALAQRYPDDQAVGYAVGDLRGALIVERRR